MRAKDLCPAFWAWSNPIMTKRLPTCKLWAVGSNPAYIVLHSFSRKAAISWPCSLGKKFEIMPCLSDKFKRFLEAKCLFNDRNVCNFILKTIFLFCVFLFKELNCGNQFHGTNLQVTNKKLLLYFCRQI